MKKILSLIFSTLLIFLLIGCTSNNKSDDDIDVPPIGTSSTNEGDEDTNSNSDTDNTDSDSNDISSVEEVNCRIFLFDTTTLTPYYVDKNITVTNYNLAEALISELQTSYGDNFLTLTNKVSLISSSIDSNSNILKLTFSDDYTSYMTLGTATEGALISTIVNTLAYNLKTDKVAIYFNDILYTCLSGELSEGYFEPYYDDSVEYTEYSEPNKETTDLYRIYYYDGSADKIVYIDKDLTVTGGAVITALTTALKTPPNTEEFVLIPSSTGVSSAKLDTENNILIVNLNKDYYEILSSVGSSSEASIFDTLALTYGYNYGVDKVIITIDGNPYSGSHFTLNANEYIDISSLIPLTIPYVEN